MEELDREGDLVEVSVGVEKFVTGECLDDEMKESMTEINPKVVNQYSFGLPTTYSSSQ